MTPGCARPALPTRHQIAGEWRWLQTARCAACAAGVSPVVAQTPAADGAEPPPGVCVECALPRVRQVMIRTPHSARWVRSGPRCDACDEAHASEQRRQMGLEMIGRSGLPERYAGYSYARIEVQGPTESIADVAARVRHARPPVLAVTMSNAAAVRALRAMGPTSPSIYLAGPVGSGKTTLIAAACADLARAGVAVVYSDEAGLYEAARDAGDWRASTQRRGRLAAMMHAPVLAIDDIGTIEARTPWHRDVVERVICVRYDRRLPVLIGSNLELDELRAGYSARVGSRLSEMCGGVQLEVSGHEWRTGVTHDVSASEPRQMPLAYSPPTAPTADEQHRRAAEAL